MKKIFLYRFIAIVLMCFSSLLIKSENVACKLTCTSFSSCKMQQEKIMNDTQQNFLYNNEGFFIKI